MLFRSDYFFHRTARTDFNMREIGFWVVLEDVNVCQEDLLTTIATDIIVLEKHSGLVAVGFPYIVIIPKDFVTGKTAYRQHRFPLCARFQCDHFFTEKMTLHYHKSHRTMSDQITV